MAQSEERYIVSTLYGGSGGDHWDDGVYHGVRQITLRIGGFIDLFGVVYEKNGERIQANTHGKTGGSPKTIIFGANEVLKTVSGSVGAAGPLRVIRSLKFETNITTYGPFGNETDNQFTLTVKDGDQIIGFFGRSGSYLDAIGVHVETHP